MSEWDDPKPSTAGFTRRQLLGGAGALAALGGAGVVFSDDLTGASEQLVQFEDTAFGETTVNIDADVSVTATAEITDTTDPDPEVGIEVRHSGSDTVVLAETGGDSVTARGQTEASGPHQVFVAATGAFEATLTRQTDGLL